MHCDDGIMTDSCPRKSSWWFLLARRQ